MRIVDIVAEPLLAHMEISKSEARKSATELLKRVGLSASLARRFPSDLSGGQAQRVAIARAVAEKNHP